MIFKQYGNLGFKVSAVGFGAMRFDMSLTESENANLIEYAVDKGITYLDTAPGYCSDKSEIILGKAIKQMGRKKEWTIATKGMPMEFPTSKSAIEAVKKSLKRLKVDCIDFYHVWCLRRMEHYDFAMRPDGQYEGLLRAKEQGLIKYIVCSSHQEGNGIKKVVEHGKFAGILLGANILNFPFRWEGVQAAHKAGMGVIAMNPLGGGAIAKHAKKLEFLCEKNESPVDAALRFVIGCKEYTVALVGFTTREHIDQAVRAAETACEINKTYRDKIEKRLGKGMNEVCTGCGYCLKECPKNIPIANYLQFYNDKVMFGTSDSTMKNNMQGSMMWGILNGCHGKAKTCISCKKCEKECTQHLPIIKRLKELASWEPEKDAGMDQLVSADKKYKKELSSSASKQSKAKKMSKSKVSKPKKTKGK